MTAPGSYALEKFSSGGLLLDLQSGGFFTLNESATFIWASWLEGVPVTKIAEALAANHDLPPAAARDDVTRTLKIEPKDANTLPPPGEFLYQRSTKGYVFSRGGKPLLTIDESGDSIELNKSAAMGSIDIRSVLQAISPKLIALRGDFVLHASGVVLDGAIVAFSGESGAGKTTTARALVRAGASPFCEDKLIVREVEGRAEGLIDAEERIWLWTEATAGELATGSRASCLGLDGRRNDQWIPLREIGLIDVTRRAGKSMSATTLTPVESASSIFRNAFYGSDVRADWKRQLQDAAAVARATRAYDLIMPNGTAALDVVAADLADSRSLEAFRRLDRDDGVVDAARGI
jgi:hypothetical protein